MVEQNVWIAFAFTLFAGLSTGIGSVFSLLHENNQY
jgi:hypothetical protein